METIQPTELRIGNYLHDGVGRLCTVEQIWDKKNHIDQDDADDCELFSAPANHGGITRLPHKRIEISDDWLIRFGFNKHQGEYWCESHEEFYDVDKYTKGDFEVYYEGQKQKWIDSLIGDGIEFVHELQNLWYLKTKEELKRN